MLINRFNRDRRINHKIGVDALIGAIVERAQYQHIAKTVRRHNVCAAQAVEESVQQRRGVKGIDDVCLQIDCNLASQLANRPPPKSPPKIWRVSQTNTSACKYPHPNRAPVVDSHCSHAQR